jgi:hypothetical protein
MYQHLHRNNRKLAVLLVAVMFYGCAARPIHPGAANTFDSGAYDSLLVAHSIIESTKTQLSTSDGFPANIAPMVRTTLSYLIDSYNVAQKAYMVYHGAAMQGQATTAMSDNLSATLADVNAKTVALTAAKNGKP